MNVTLRQLRVFQSVAETRNFSRTGERIGLTQPAVSRAIVELESGLGVRLLDRTTREVLLTEAGRSLASRLERALDELDGVLSEVAGLADADGGKVRVASAPTLSAYLMPACIATCAREAPRVRFMLVDDSQRDVLQSVRDGEVDFGVVVEPLSLEGLHYESILRDPFVLIAPPGHELLRSRSVPWRALDGCSLVLLDANSGSRRYIDAALARHRATCTVAQQLSHITTVFRMIEAGIGLSVMPALSVPVTGLPGLEVRPLRPRLERTVMLVRRANRALSPVAERVWNLVSATVRARSAGVLNRPGIAGGLQVRARPT
ncbi:MAG TPA: LysR family transcriptional regulator [Burkholderiaceae bacterium]|nr:LysR family transcriptional regulator [Burkholderiaceae bacterium]